MAVKYMTPIVVLSDGYIANSAEPWLIPDVDSLERTEIQFAQPQDIGEFLPYSRDPETGARPWAIPGTPGLEHRIGGLTKADLLRFRIHTVCWIVAGVGIFVTLLMGSAPGASTWASTRSSAPSCCSAGCASPPTCSSA